MNFVLFVEGQTEDKALREFLLKWLNQTLTATVGIKTVRFDGWSDLVKGAKTKTHWHLNNPQEKDSIIAVISLLDLYGPTFPYPKDKTTAAERYQWAKAHMEKQIGHPQFRQHFAVHETEAWLLSDPAIFPGEVRKALEGKYSTPETVNSEEPPAKLLAKLYSSKTGRQYKKVTNGKELFAKLNPALAYRKCPHLKILLDEMLLLAQQADGL